MANEEIKGTAGQKSFKLSTGRVFNIKVKSNNIDITIHCDPDDPDNADDSATLESTDGSYKQTVRWADAKPVDGGVTLTFKRIEADKSYNLLIDPGKDGDPFYVARNVPLSQAKLQEMQS